MQTAILLITNIPSSVRNLRNDLDSYKKIPTHITMAYLKSESNLAEVMSSLKSMKRFQITFDDISCDKDHLALLLDTRSDDRIEGIMDKIKKHVDRKPKNGYHMSIAYSKKSWDLYKSEDIHNMATKKFDLPVDVTAKEIWIVQKTKNGGAWPKIHSMKLHKDIPASIPQSIKTQMVPKTKATILSAGKSKSRPKPKAKPKTPARKL